MSTLISLTGSLDDIVFEGRNKAYGAFELRQRYAEHVRRALAITLCLCLGLLLSPAAIRYLAPAVAELPQLHHDGELEFTEVNINPVIPPVATTKQVVEVPAAAVVLPHDEIATRVVPDDEVKPLTATSTNLLQDVGRSGPDGGLANTTGSTGGTPGGTSAFSDTATPAPAVPAPIANYAEIMPAFAGGQDALRAYLQKHVRYPAAALANQIAGKVYVSFVVQTDGSVTDVQTVKGLGFGTEEAAARAVREMPAWTPGKQNNHAVPVRFILPITFQYE